MLYKKDISNKLIIFTILLFSLICLSFHLILDPFRSVEADLKSLEKNISSKNWKQASSDLDTIESTWSKYEVVLRILNSQDIADEFELHLNQCQILAKYENDMILEYLSILEDDVKSMMHVIPNP